MANKVEDLVNVILDSYNECDITARIDEENMLNKDILIEIIDEIRKVLFPGFFDNNKVRSEYLKFLVGERLEFIQYHLKKQVSNAFANQDVCRECSKAQAEEKAEEVVFEFLKKIPKIREYLNTDIQAAYDGDPAAYSTRPDGQPPCCFSPDAVVPVRHADSLSLRRKAQRVHKDAKDAS